MPGDAYANLTTPSAPVAPAPASISGAIRDAENNPVGGAWVCRRAYLWTDTCAQSDADGYYRLDDLPAHAVEIGVSSSTFEPSERQLVLQPSQTVEHVDFDLQPGGERRSGVVRDIFGEAVAGARISSDHAVTFSDERGHFELWTAADDRRLEVVADGHVELSWSVDKHNHPVELILTPGVVIRGRVVDARTGAPVAGAEVSTYSPYGASHARGQTDDGGRFHLGGLLPNDYRIQVSGHEHQGANVDSVHLGLAETSGEVVIEALPAAYVTGSVTIADTQQPCTGGEVRVMSMRAGEPDPFSSVRGSIDKNGLFELSGVLPGHYSVWIQCDDYQSYDSYPTLVVGEHNVGGIEWTVTDRPATRWKPRDAVDDKTPNPAWTSKIRGRVIDEIGVPIADFRVHPYYPDDHDIHIRSVTTDDHGAFEIGGLPAGQVTMMVDDGSRWVRSQRVLDGKHIRLSEGADVEVELVIESRYDQISGVFRDEQGAPIAGAVVIIFDDFSPGFDNPRSSPVFWERNDLQITDARGRFTFTGLPEQEFWIHGYRVGGGEAVAEHVQAGTNVDLVITQPSTLSGTVLHADGTAPSGWFSVEAEDLRRGFELWSRFEYSNGAWRLNNLPASTYMITVDVGGDTAMVRVELGEGEQRGGIDLRVPSTRTAG